MNDPTTPSNETDEALSSHPKIVHHSSSVSLAEWEETLKNNGVSTNQIASLNEISVASPSLNVIILDELLARGEGLQKLEEFDRNQSPTAVIVLADEGKDFIPDGALSSLVSGALQHPFKRSTLLLALRGGFRHASLRRAAQTEATHRETLSRNLENLTRIGIALSAEQNNHRLLDMILTHSRELTNADAGSLYLVEEAEDGASNLRFKHTQNDSKEIPFQEFVMPATKSSISGYVGVTGETLNIHDVYTLSGDVEYSFNKTFDQSVGYRSKSMLVVPMRDHHNEITGVLQLINAKPSPDDRIPDLESAERIVVPFDPEIEQVITSLASQAAVSLENSMLLESIENTFEGLVKASVHAIEQRDPITSGHSERVTALTCALAEAVGKTKEGRYTDVSFTEEEMKELRYAGLLHDFGKIGVREHVLVKANKLYPLERDLVVSRFELIRRTLQSEYQEKMLEAAKAGQQDEVERLQAEMNTHLQEATDQLELVLRCDIPTMMPDGDFDDLEKLSSYTYRDLENDEKPYLTDYEVSCLSLKRGNLTGAERKEIESHVSHSYNFLVQIPWSRTLRGVPEIAHGHHEKLNGEGYPRGIKDEEIVLQAKIMCVCDIFDALTASDRPYKKAAPLDRAIQILKFEVKDQHLCPELVDIFIKNKVYQAVDAFKDSEYVEPDS